MKEILQKLWEDKIQFLDFTFHFKNREVLDICELAIILSANKHNYERYLVLEPFNNILKKIDLRSDIFSIQKAQICILNMFKEGFVSKKELLKALELLQEISDSTDLLLYIKNTELEVVDKKALFENIFYGLHSINVQLSDLSLDQNTRLRLKKTWEKFEKLQFNIVITGIINSGKSSLLNALLREDFLGVSNIPETANLTLLSYGHTQEAVIHFWNKEEWQDISKNFNHELRLLVDELSLKTNIEDYIKDQTLSQKIKLAELKKFSSAKNPISILVKKIEMKSDWKFLKNNICIVDTPGLDDIIVQREILTNQYLKESDFLIHLMNASQALTQKDCEFLIHCLFNSRLNKFLILLTKADLLSPKELDEVIHYTKESLKMKLENLDTNLVEKIDFLCVSAKMANDFYKGLSSEQDFKKSGMIEFEAYLLNQLYSGEKSTIILQSYKKELLLEIKYILSQYEMKNKFIGQERQNLSQENNKLLAEFRQKEKRIKQARDAISNSILDLKCSHGQMDNLILLLAKNLKERLIDELKYLKDRGQKININRILHIVDITVKDGISDILRELKFENIKKMEELKTTLALKYDFLRDDFDSDFEDFKERSSKNIENIFNSEQFASLKLQIEQIISLKKDVFEIETALLESIVRTFKSFNMDAVFEQFNINGAFLSFLNEKMANYEILQREELVSIKDLMENMNNQNLDLSHAYEENLAKIAKLKQFQMELMSANEYST